MKLNFKHRKRFQLHWLDAIGYTIAAALLILPILFNAGSPTQTQTQSLPIWTIALVNGKSIHLEIARSPEQQQLGLMHRTRLEPNSGMLFPVNPPAIVPVWMKNVKFPLDLIFIKDGKVAQIIPNVPPCFNETCPVYHSERKVNTLIEISAGQAKKLGLEEGQDIYIQPMCNKIKGKDVCWR